MSRFYSKANLEMCHFEIGDFSILASFVLYWDPIESSIERIQIEIMSKSEENLEKLKETDRFLQESRYEILRY